mmetsp:Transcript_9134/g.21508  ORF Transcript_9134/g.21508 Transcript_9134/m.21508 type:complete len:254 (-) Transcript_9134:262-1023(-)
MRAHVLLPLLLFLEHLHHFLLRDRGEVATLLTHFVAHLELLGMDRHLAVQPLTSALVDIVRSQRGEAHLLERNVELVDASELVLLPLEHDRYCHALALAVYARDHPDPAAVGAAALRLQLARHAPWARPGVVPTTATRHLLRYDVALPQAHATRNHATLAVRANDALFHAKPSHLVRRQRADHTNRTAEEAQPALDVHAVVDRALEGVRRHVDLHVCADRLGGDCHLRDDVYHIIRIDSGHHRRRRFRAPCAR